MTLLAAVGQAQALDGREAGLQAAHQALNQLGSASCILGLVMSSHQYEAQQVVNGVCSLLGATPLVGFSTPAGLTSAGSHPHSVVVALLSASDAKADVNGWPGTPRGGTRRCRGSPDYSARTPLKPPCSSLTASTATLSNYAPASRRPRGWLAPSPAATCTPGMPTRSAENRLARAAWLWPGWKVGSKLASDMGMVGSRCAAVSVCRAHAAPGCAPWTGARLRKPMPTCSAARPAIGSCRPSTT